MALMQKISDIALAVQNVTGDSTPITLDQMPQKIRNLAGGNTPITFQNSSYNVTINLQKLKGLLQKVGFNLNQTIQMNSSDDPVVTIGFGVPVFKSTILPYGYYSSGEQSYQNISGPNRRLFTIEIDTNSTRDLIGYCNNHFNTPSSVGTVPTTFNELFNDFAEVSPSTFSMNVYGTYASLADIILFPMLIIDNGSNQEVYNITNSDLNGVFNMSPSSN